MDFNSAEEQKVFLAEKRISVVRAVVIVFGTLTFFLTKNPYTHEELAYLLMVFIWSYGAFVLYFKPYEKYPVFLAGWFTYIGDGLFTTLWIYATGGFYSPYHVIYYTSIIAVAFRFGFRTTMFTSGLYSACYILLLFFLSQLEGNEGMVLLRCGFNFIIGALAHQITRETLMQAKQKFAMKDLMEEAQQNHRKLAENAERLNALNRELQLRNDRFSHAEENALIGSFALYMTTRRQEYSDNLFRLLGHEPGDFAPSFERLFTFIHPDDREKAIKETEAALEKNIIPVAVYRIITRQGELRFFRISGRMLGERPNEVLIGTVQDVSSDIRLNETLRQKNIELERSNQELSSFNYIASHDLQEPVRKIITFSDLVVEKAQAGMPENLKGYLSRIGEAAHRMQHLIEALVSYYTISSSTPKLEELDFYKLVREVKEKLDEENPGKSLQLSHGRLPRLTGSSYQLKQLLHQIMSNSVKYCKPDGCPEIEIQAVKVNGNALQKHGADPNKEFWKISFTDKGIGFDQQYAERIFGVFQRLHSRDSYTGTGMGLAICKKVAFSHQGFIEASGEPGVGATFTLYLPVTFVNSYKAAV